MPLTPPRPHPTRTLLVLSLATATFALAMSSVIPALGELQRAYSTDTAGVAWIITGYLVMAAVSTPITGRLGDMFGKRRMLVISLSVFAVGSTLAALATTLEVVVAGRVIQGLAGGVFPLCFGIIRDEFPLPRVPFGIALVSTVAGVGSTFGFVGGGILAAEISYHWIFWSGTITALIAAVAAQLLVPESPVRRPGRVDFRGAAVLAVGLVLPLAGISRATTWGWTDPRVLGLVGAGALVLSTWARLQRRTAAPLADIAMLRSPPVLMTNIATFLVGFGMFGSFVLVPQLAGVPDSSGYGLGLTTTGAGLLLLPGSLASLLTGPIGGAIAMRVGARIPLILGGTLATVGLALLGFSHGSVTEVVVYTTILFSGIGFAFAAMPNLIIAAVPATQTGEATGFNALVRSAGSSVGSQVAASILAGSAVAGTTIPSDGGFTTAFLVSAGVAALATVAAIRVPVPPVGPSARPAADRVAAAPPAAPAVTMSRA